MHNCNSTRKRLTDLALNEIPLGQKESLLAELKDCADCREEFASIRETLRVSERALVLAGPEEGFWTGYHNRLAQRLQDPIAPCAPAPASRAAQLWSRLRALATASVRVPVPAAAALLALCFGVGILIADTRPSPVMLAPPQPAQVITKTITVPQERVVTRVVYVERNRARARHPERNITEPSMESLANSVTTSGPETPDPAAMSLVGFKPTDQVKLKITKGSYRDER